MGTELWYVPIPDDSSLLERVKKDPIFGKHLDFLSHYADKEKRAGSPEPGEEDFAREARKIYTSTPDLHKRIFTIDRYYDILFYLLSDKRRQDITTTGMPNADIGAETICGVQTLPDYCEGGQGHPIRYSNAKDVARIHQFLDPIGPDDLKRIYNPSDMENKGVYKFFADQANDDTWKWIIHYFNVLKTGYREVALHNEALIVRVT